MRIELPCDIVQDLLPSYIDELTGEMSTESVAAHLETCETCRKIYRDMKGEEPEAAEDPGRAEEAIEVNYLKKTRSRGRMAVLGGIALTAVLVLGVVFWRFYLMSSVTSSYMMNLVIVSDEDQQYFEVSGDLVDYDRGVASVTWEEDGDTLNLVVKSSLRSFFRDNTIYSWYRADGRIRQITVNGSVPVWYEGEQIRSDVAQIYKDKTPYVGSIEAIGKLAQDVGLSTYLKTPCTTELQTVTEPYGWMYHGSEAITEEIYEEYEMTLPRYGALLIAAIDNLSYMEFDFDVAGERRTIRITEEDADRMLEKPVKEWVASPVELQEAVAALGVRPNIYGSTQSMGPYVQDNFDFRVDNDCLEEIYGFSVSLSVNGEVISTTSTINADYSPLEKGRIGAFTFTPEDGDRTIDMEKDAVSVTFTICGEGKDMSNILDTMTVDLDPTDATYYDGRNYRRTFTLSGSSGTGFRVQ